MEYIRPMDPTDFIEAAEREKTKCILQYFGELSLNEAMNPEILEEKYRGDILEQLRADYYGRLKAIWNRSPLGTRKPFEEAYDLPDIVDAGNIIALDKAQKSASRRSLWEKLTKTNHKDITEYKALLQEYGEALLSSMQDNFSAALFTYARAR